MTGAAAARFREPLQRRLRFVLFDHAAGRGDERRVLGLDRRAFGIAAPAGTEAGRPGALQRVVNPDVLRVRGARGARGSTIDARRCDGVPELAVGTLVA